MNKLLSEKEIKKFNKPENLTGRLSALIEHQKENWNLARDNYESLNVVEVKEFLFDDEKVLIQHNPQRVSSTTADVSEKAVNTRECILCEQNLPDGQKFLRYYKEYNFLVNPYPILREHFTIAKTKHVPQSIINYLGDLLLLSRDVGDKYAVFYNGSKCGASLPEHLHFQMGNKEQLPLFNLISDSKKNNLPLVIETKKISIRQLTTINRNAFVVESKDNIELLNFFSVLKSFIQKALNKREEPLLNIASFYENHNWILVIFLRKKHRPDAYYSKGELQLLISPASIDMSGLIITPRKNDFEKIDERVISNIFREVSISKELNEYLLLKLEEFYLSH